MLQVKTDFRLNSPILEGECFMTYPNTERWVGKKREATEFFRPTSNCLETETLFRVLLKTLIIVREIQSKI